jgi:hypothetical protein
MTQLSVLSSSIILENGSRPETPLSRRMTRTFAFSKTIEQERPESTVSSNDWSKKMVNFLIKKQRAKEEAKPYVPPEHYKVPINSDLRTLQQTLQEREGEKHHEIT